MSRTSARATWSSPASTMPASSAWPRRRRTSSSGTAATTIFPFVRPDLHIVLVDPLRPGHETTHHPGEAVLRMADIVVVAKTNSASEADIRRVTRDRAQPRTRCNRGARCLHRVARRSSPSRRQARSRRGGRPDHHPWRHGLRRGLRRGDPGWREGDRRSQVVRGRRHRRGVPPLPAHRQGAARHGVFGEGARRAAGNHQRHRAPMS